MKNLTLFMIFVCIFHTLSAQQTDTTKVKIGNSKVVIINNKGQVRQPEEIEVLLKEKHKTLNLLTEDSIKQRAEILKQEQINAKNTNETEIDSLNAKLVTLKNELKTTEAKIANLKQEIKALNELNKNNSDEEDWNFGTKDNSQNNSTSEWDVSWDWDDINLFGRRKKFRGHWAGLEFGLNSYVDKNQNLTLSGDNENFELKNSGCLNINFLEYNIPFTKFAGLVTGMGFTANSYRFDKNVNIVETSDDIITAVIEQNHSYSKNKLVTSSLTMPLLLEIQVPRHLYLSVGVIGSLRLSSYTKQKYRDNTGKYKFKHKSDFNMNNLRYGLTVRLGCRFLKFFATYDLVPLFKENHGPELYPVSVGISLFNF